jgi:type IV pilus assembly protein PilC
MTIFRSRSLSLFYRELSTLLSGGMAVVQALGELVGHVGYGSFRDAVWHIQSDVEQGGTLAGAFAKFPRFFPEWQVGVIGAGERSGTLVDSLKMIADQLEKNYSDMLKLAVGLSYPLFMFVISLLALPFMNIGSCPAKGCAAGFYKTVLLVVAACAGGYFLWRKAGPREGYLLQAAVLRVPVFGGLVRQLAVTRFVRALKSLSSSGAPIITAWKVAAGASGNEAIRKSLLEAMKPLEAGGTISEALERAHIFPAYMIGLIVSGEKSGSIVKMLESAASFCEKENDAAIGVLLKIVPVVVYIAVAFFIGFSVISAYSRYFNSMTTVQ